MTSFLRNTSAFVFAALVAGAVGVAFAHHAGGDGAKRNDRVRGRVIERLLNDAALREQLGVTPEQTERLSRIQEETRKSLTTLRRALRLERAELGVLLDDADATRDQIEAQLKALAGARDAVREEVSQAFLDARDVLSVEQRRALRDEIERKIRRRGPVLEQDTAPE